MPTVLPAQFSAPKPIATNIQRGIFCAAILILSQIALCCLLFVLNHKGYISLDQINEGFTPDSL